MLPHTTCQTVPFFGTVRLVVMEVLPSRTATVGDSQVRRALPQRTRRTIGAWCFVDHFGPSSPGADDGLGVGPHPHCGLSTVTWLLEGMAVHADSLSFAPADSIVPLSHSEHQAALVQDGTVVVKPGAGHFAGFTVIEEVLDTVDLRWLDRGSRP